MCLFVRHKNCASDEESEEEHPLTNFALKLRHFWRSVEGLWRGDQSGVGAGGGETETRASHIHIKVSKRQPAVNVTISGFRNIGQGYVVCMPEFAIEMKAYMCVCSSVTKIVQVRRKVRRNIH